LEGGKREPLEKMAAGDILTVKVNTSKIDLRLDQMPGDVRAALAEAIEVEGQALLVVARERASTLLQVRTGRFVRHIKFGERRGKNKIAGRVYSADRRAKLFEWGGHTPAHEIKPRGARALLLHMRGGGTRFAAGVHHPGGTYKRLQIIHGAFDQMKGRIDEALQEAVASAVRARPQ
jgi:hypothetical protein